MLDRRAARVKDLLRISCFPNVLALKSAVESYGARLTRVAGEDYVIKNNRQREHIAQDVRAMDFWLKHVMMHESVIVADLRKWALQADIPWTLLCRIAREQGWYVVEETPPETVAGLRRRPSSGAQGIFNGLERLEFVGYEMDYDLRYLVCGVLKEALESGVDVDSPLAYGMVETALLGRFVSQRDYEICVDLVKSGFYGADVE
jgi:hypothetical protein